MLFPLTRRTVMVKRGAKSAAIREYIEQKPGAKAREVIDALAKQRIKVSANQVYALLNKSNGEAAPKAPEATAPESNGQLPAYDTVLLQAKEFAVAAGGIEQARWVLDALSKLQLAK
jgi:hypothetical protein